MLEVAGLHFRYPGARGLALAGLNLAVGEGEYLAVVGAAGAGKTTLAACLGGRIPHFQDGEWAGSVRIDGRATGDLPPAALAQLVGTVSSDPDRQLVAMTVEEEVAFGLENLCLPRPEIEERLQWALETMGIAHLRNRATRILSGGEKGRLILAATLALRPRLLVLDEPVAELDPAGAAQVMRAVAELHRRLGTTVIHLDCRLSNVVAQAARLVLLHQGRILADGPTRALATDERLLARAGLQPPPVVRAASALGWRSRDGLMPLTIDELEMAAGLLAMGGGGR